MKPLKSIIALFAVSFVFSCQTPGPAIEVCSFHGNGTARCVQHDGETVIDRMPHELEKYIGTNPEDWEKLLTWMERECG